MNILQDNELITEIAEENISKNNIFVHATTWDGVNDVFWKDSGYENYLSCSSFQSTRFISKGKNTIYLLLKAEKQDIEFHEWGDIGWKGNTPKKTTWDEVGLNDWEVLGYYIPWYQEENEWIQACTILSQWYDEVDRNCILPIYGKPGKLSDSEMNEKLIEISENLEKEYPGFTDWDRETQMEYILNKC